MTDRTHSVLDELAHYNPVPVEGLGDSWNTPGARHLLSEITARPRTEATPAWDDPSWDDPIIAGGRFRSMRVPLFTAGALAACAAFIVGLVFVTTGSPRQNGQSTWQLVSVVRSPFRSLPSGEETEVFVTCVSDQICYEHGLGTQTSTLWRTTDGGENWVASKVPVVPGTDAGFELTCSGPTTCAALSDSVPPSSSLYEAQLAITTDGGTTWTTSAVPLPNADVQTKFACSDGEHCVVGGGGVFISTSDGGATWTQASTPTISGQLWNLTCQPDGACLAVYLLQDGVRALSSTNWGVTWSAGAVQTLPQVGPIVYASCADATHCMLVSVGGPSTRPFEIVTTDNAGVSWNVSGPPAGWSNMPTAVGCATATDCSIAMSTYGGGNAAYSDPVIESTTDGGETWTPSALPVTTPPLADVIDLACPSSGDGCMGVGVGADHMSPPPGYVGPLSQPLIVSSLPGLPPS